MTVTDGDRYAIAMAKLSQARSAVYEATKIIEHLFESDGVACAIPNMSVSGPSGLSNTCDPVTGLFDGQIPNAKEEEDTECLD